MALDCVAAYETPRDVIAYQREQTDERRVAILLALEKGPGTIDEIIRRIGSHIHRKLFYHYDAETNYTCRGHVENSEVLETTYGYAEVRRTMVSLEKKGAIGRFEAEEPPHLWYSIKL